MIWRLPGLSADGGLALGFLAAGATGDLASFGRGAARRRRLPKLPFRVTIAGMELLVATLNHGKRRELSQLLAPLGARLRFPAELGLQLEVAEDGATYAENASKKALAYARASGLLTLADDSGLEVDALDGAPGVCSARYVPGSDADRVAALLERLREMPMERRAARFRCVVAIATPDGALYMAEGVCEGRIAEVPAGEGGFGYDPIFYLPEYGCTMAELPSQEKNRISHRARAIEAALPILRSLGVGLRSEPSRR